MDQEVKELRKIVDDMAIRLKELEKLLLTYRQASIIMVAGSEKYLGLERSREPKHKKRSQ